MTKGVAITSEVYAEIKQTIYKHPRMDDDAIARITGLSRTTIYNVRKSGSFREYKDLRDSKITKPSTAEIYCQEYRFCTYIIHVISIRTLDEKLTFRIKANAKQASDYAREIEKVLRINPRKYAVVVERSEK